MVTQLYEDDAKSGGRQSYRLCLKGSMSCRAAKRLMTVEWDWPEKQKPSHSPWRTEKLYFSSPETWIRPWKIFVYQRQRHSSFDVRQTASGLQDEKSNARWENASQGSRLIGNVTSGYVVARVVRVWGWARKTGNQPEWTAWATESGLWREESSGNCSGWGCLVSYWMPDSSPYQLITELELILAKRTRLFN